MWIYQHKNWPNFTWQSEKIADELAAIRYEQGKLLGRIHTLGFDLRTNATWHVLTEDVLKNSLIEGEYLSEAEVRSSVARKLGLNAAGLVNASRHVDGMVQMMADASQNYQQRLSRERLLFWHAGLFPDGLSGGRRIRVGQWRDNTKEDPMQVVSGAMGRERVHFQAPDADSIEREMQIFLMWLNGQSKLDMVVKAAIAHLWFLTLHPFEDGNGRMARAISDLLLARSENTSMRCYSLSAAIAQSKQSYYEILEKTQRGNLDITEWIEWFLQILLLALHDAEYLLDQTLFRASFWQKENLIGLNERQHTMLQKLLDDFKGNLTSSKWAKMTKVSQDTAQRDINDLIARGILIKEDGGGRSTSYRLTH